MHQHGAPSALPGWIAKQPPCLPGNGVRLYQALSERTSLLPFITSLTNSVFHSLFPWFHFYHWKMISSSMLPSLCVLLVNFWKWGICLALPPSSCAIDDSKEDTYSTGEVKEHNGAMISSPGLDPCLAQRNNESWLLLRAYHVPREFRQALTCTDSCEGWKSDKRNILMATGWTGSSYSPKWQVKKPHSG